MLPLPDPILRYEPATNRFFLLEDYVTPEVTVPKGEFTDGASRPEWADFLVDRYDRHLPACIVHDYMYRQALILPGYELDPKKGADDLFEINLIRCAKLYGFNDTVIPFMVKAVRIGGQGAYK